MALYRPMRAGEDGKPVVARKRWGLGVRIKGPKVDVVVADGKVRPLGGGMSVARDWNNLPRSLVPQEMGGTNKTETMFALAEEDLPGRLRVRRSGPREGHYVVEPGRGMPIEEYEGLLEGTKDKWERVT